MKINEKEGREVKLDIEMESNPKEVENNFQSLDITNDEDPKAIEQGLNREEEQRKKNSVDQSVEYSSKQEESNVTKDEPDKYLTLDEPISESIKRDLVRIWHKIIYVVIPRFNADVSIELKNWDLWGPLVLCLFLAITLSLGGKKEEDKGLVFILIFVIQWIGGAIVTLNAQFLGSRVSIAQSVCLLGYCLFPIILAAAIIKLALIENFVKLIIVLLGLIWSTFSSIGFMSQLVEADRKAIALYPVILYYSFIAWFVLTL